ncbi:hypothetical protein N7456_011873 [Penicillium angulare]|uniref:Large ribosomal subunit protein mL50 n=1 Tax=Penicillium angulare TaxID=116970 RepID=A0A9W9EUG8_9EURO|nr:hypothetical protein N7456_011873 [Penicillium angulare]
MRPAMRLPLREALYVCSNCRQETLPRISPLARQFRRYASSDESPGFLERTRRQLWSEKPPGAADPYTGQSQMNQAAEQSSGKEEGGLQAGEESGEDLTVGSEYVQADTWNGLDVIGFTEEKEWLVRGSDPEADQYTRYDADVKVRKLPLAFHQTAVEICLMKMLGKPLTEISSVATHHHVIQKMIDDCVVVGSESWETALRFPNQKAMETLSFVFNQIGEKTETQIGTPEKFILENKEAASELRTLSLADSNVKFAFAKRFSQLIGRRIPDKIISSSNTTGEFVAGIDTRLKEKPINVTKKLAKRARAGVLPPNLQFSSKRISKADHDEAVGRKKAIISELYNRGLYVPQDKSKPSGLQ